MFRMPRYFLRLSHTRILCYQLRCFAKPSRDLGRDKEGWTPRFEDADLDFSFLEQDEETELKDELSEIDWWLKEDSEGRNEWLAESAEEDQRESMESDQRFSKFTAEEIATASEAFELDQSSKWQKKSIPDHLKDQFVIVDHRGRTYDMEKYEREVEIKKFLETQKKTKSKVPEIDENGETMAIGRRKTAMAKVVLKPGSGDITVNGIDYTQYFRREFWRGIVTEPLYVTQTHRSFDVDCSASGGGTTGQAGAVGHGISKALAARFPGEYDEALGVLLLRDVRMKERKKTGQPKARKGRTYVRR